MIKVSAKGVAEVTGQYTRNTREITTTLEVERRLSRENIPLSDRMGACL